MVEKKLTDVHFDFFYLVRLTEEGLKPLSRWEAGVSNNELALIERARLKFATIERHLNNGLKTQELIFSHSVNLIKQYRARFQGQPIDKSAASQRFEGLLFGYPSCCIDHFIEHPYQTNSLSAADQRILFHWACPTCAFTPQLLPKYRRIYQQCIRSFNADSLLVLRQRAKSHRHRVVAIATSLALLNLATANCSRDFFFKPQPYKPNEHLYALPLESDADQDFLEDRLEQLLQVTPQKADTDNDGIPDGPDWAQQLWLIYRSLPDQPRSNAPYVENHLMRGLETCRVCNHTVNMGYALLINPLENLSLEAPYIFLHHFFEHGSFSYDGTLHGEGRINAALLKIILTANGRSHWLGENYSDQQVQTARRIAAKVDSLPRTTQTDQLYAIDHQMKGIEMCHCCGEYFNMGFITIHNPIKQISYDLPYVALHFLQCGSLQFAADYHSGKVDITSLLTILEK